MFMGFWNSGVYGVCGARVSRVYVVQGFWGLGYTCVGLMPAGRLTGTSGRATAVATGSNLVFMGIPTTPPLGYPVNNLN